jgi:sporadic carbohydrate cluster 2OG-Fe(II) oxygenase
MSDFFSNEENILNNNFIKKGYVICKIENQDSINWLRNFYLKKIELILGKKINDADILNNFHKYIKLKNLNEFRLKLINEINKSKIYKQHYYKIAKKYLEILVGNELVMQKSINLSIQLPKDNSSLLEVHADTWSGDSPFEVVVWLPLVDCFKTKSMYILPANKYGKFLKKFKESHTKKNFNLYKSIEKDLKWINIKFGEVLLFNQNLPHGNIVNKINETRWTNNCRFKSVFTPYGDKKIGEFFQPITLRAASKIGMKYELPLEK